VPLIVWAVTVLLSINTFNLELAGQTITYTPAIIFFTLSMLYYLKLHIKLGLGMLVYTVINIYLASLVADMENAVWIGISAFVIGWVIQFIGHIYEKAKPAFFDDIMGLAIGPLFLMSEIYFMLGFEKNLEKNITPMAIEKRRLLERAK
jgi:uncharacterized membrane protein YGL010W